MIPPFGQAAKPDFADELLAEAGARVAARREREAAERQAMSPEQLMKALNERGSRGEYVGVRLRELRRSHYEANGADGG